MTSLLERAGLAAPGDGRRPWVWSRLLPLTFVTGILVWLVGFSTVLGVRSVSVRGEHLVTAQQIRDAAAVGHGQPLIRVDTDAIAKRVEQLKPVLSAKVSVSYPSTVVITVRERKAIGVIGSAGSYSLVDTADVAFVKVASPPAGLPLITRYQDARDDATAAVAGQVPPTLAAMVASMDAASPQAVALHLRDGRTVLWGGTDRAGEKAQLMKVLLGQPGTYFDLSDPDTVISRGAPSPSPTS